MYYTVKGCITLTKKDGSDPITLDVAEDVNTMLGAERAPGLAAEQVLCRPEHHGYTKATWKEGDPAVRPNAILNILEDEGPEENVAATMKAAGVPSLFDTPAEPTKD